MEQSRQRIWMPACAAFAVTLLALLWGLGSVPLSGTEGHRVLPALAMVRSGDWLVPRLLQHVYFHKPPLHNWTVAALVAVTRASNEWIWRLPSATASALLAGFVALMAGRWFGRRAAWCSGFAYLSLFALWSQGRSADIDAALHFAAIVSAFSFLEINFGPRARAWPWVLLAGVSLGCALLLKGHSGLLVILAALIGPAVMTRDGRWLRRAGNGCALLLGVLMFGAWAVAALLYVRAHPVDLALGSTLRDVSGGMFVLSVKDLLDVVTRPVVLLAAGLPASLGLVFVHWRPFTGCLDEERRKRMRTLGGTVYAALVIILLAGVSNLRYTYQVLPVLAPMAGLVLAVWSEGGCPGSVNRLVRAVLRVFAVALAAAIAGVAAAGFVKGDFGWKYLPWAVVGAACGAAALRALARGQMAGAGRFGVALLCAAATGFGFVKNAERARRSAFEAALVLRDAVGSGTRVHAAKMVRTHPELFYYAEVEVVPLVPYGHDLAPTLEPEVEYLVLHATEWESYGAVPQGAYELVTNLPTHVPGTVVVRHAGGS